jgi:NAD(P)-dependent dehydrogenase (short-subunit alcohol dehydrogenase family)
MIQDRRRRQENRMNRIKAKIALVTGASSGIGEATAERLAKAGYKVYGTSRRGAQAGKQSFEMLSLDVTSDDSVEAAVAEVMRRDGRIDLLVNNAGFGVAPAGAEESSIDQARSIFETSFFGLIRMTRAVVPHMRRQGNGRIINIGSVLGFLPMPYGALYAATKHAVEGYSESLDHELRTRASGSRSSSPRTRRRRSTRTSWSRMPSSTRTARGARA